MIPLINLGKSPLKVSRLCLGSMMFADQTDLAEARSMVAYGHANGCNFIDTADVDTLGQSETMVGELLQGQRHDWVLASKVGNSMSQRPNEGHYARAWMLRACEDSLRRLKTEHIDIYYLHRDFAGLDLEEPLEPSRPCCARARYATGGCRIFGLGASARWCTWRASSTCLGRWFASPITTCSIACLRWKSWKPAGITVWAWSPTARLRAVS